MPRFIQKGAMRFLAVLASFVLKKYKPVIIAVTGSVGKTSTKEAIFSVVSSQFSARRSTKNYNNEFGVPFTILGVESPGKNIFLWCFLLLKFLGLMLLRKQYPKILILEIGADRPGDISYLTSFVKPHISVVTSVGEIPVHVEFYAGPLEVAKEKRVLVDVLGSDDYAILNYDDDTVFDMKHGTLAHAITFGFGEGAIVRALNVEYLPLEYETMAEAGGVRFQLHYKDNAVSIEMPGVLGRPQIYAGLAALSVGLALDMNLVDIASALRNFKSPLGRLRLIKGIKKSWIIDDSYNAAPQSMHSALDILETLNAKRKIAVLGDMKEIGKYTFEAHQAAGDRVAQVADVLFAVGDSAKIIAEEAKIKGLEEKSVFWFDISAQGLNDAGKKLQEMIQEGDLILVKGSQSMRLEKIVEEVMADPKKAETLLVRQNKEWKSKKV